LSPKLITSTLAVGLAGLLWALPASAGPGSARATVATVTAGKPSEFGFKLSTKSVKQGAVTFKVTNGGNLAHNFKVCASNKGGTANACPGKATPLIAPGASKTLVVTFKAKGSYEYLCAVPGHAAGGMKGLLKVT
jgi:uncharacterized cupredoxin-like copper-binding protein